MTIQTVIQIVTGSLFDPGGCKLYLIFRFLEVHTKQEMVGGCSSNLVKRESNSRELLVQYGRDYSTRTRVVG